MQLTDHGKQLYLCLHRASRGALDLCCILHHDCMPFTAAVAELCSHRLNLCSPPFVQDEEDDTPTAGGLSADAAGEAGEEEIYKKMAARMRNWRTRAMRAGRARTLAQAEVRHYSASRLPLSRACCHAVHRRRRLTLQ